MGYKFFVSHDGSLQMATCNQAMLSRDISDLSQNAVPCNMLPERTAIAKAQIPNKEPTGNPTIKLKFRIRNRPEIRPNTIPAFKYGSPPISNDLL